MIKIENGKLIIPKDSKLTIDKTRKAIKLFKEKEDKEFAKLCKYFKIDFHSEEADWLFDLVFNLDEDDQVEFK